MGFVFFYLGCLRELRLPPAAPLRFLCFVASLRLRLPPLLRCPPLLLWRGDAGRGAAASADAAASAAAFIDVLCSMWARTDSTLRTSCGAGGASSGARSVRCSRRACPGACSSASVWVWLLLPLARSGCGCGCWLKDCVKANCALEVPSNSCLARPIWPAAISNKEVLHF